MQNFRGDNEGYMNEINSLDNQIDQLVYKLYGLTPEEIEIVDGKKQN